MRIPLAFFLAPFLPSIALIAITSALDNHGRLPDFGSFIFLLFCILLISYVVILIMAKPLFFYMQARGKTELSHTVLAGFIIGILVAFLPCLALASGRSEWLKAIFGITGLGLFGACVAFMFWLIALSPLNCHCGTAIKKI